MIKNFRHLLLPLPDGPQKTIGRNDLAILTILLSIKYVNFFKNGSCSSNKKK
jgi:hypothetical protein